MIRGFPPLRTRVRSYSHSHVHCHIFFVYGHSHVGVSFQIDIDIDIENHIRYTVYIINICIYIYTYCLTYIWSFWGSESGPLSMRTMDWHVLMATNLKPIVTGIWKEMLMKHCYQTLVHLKCVKFTFSLTPCNFTGCLSLVPPSSNILVTRKVILVSTEMMFIERSDVKGQNVPSFRHIKTSLNSS